MAGWLRGEESLQNSEESKRFSAFLRKSQEMKMVAKTIICQGSFCTGGGHRVPTIRIHINVTVKWIETNRLHSFHGGSGGVLLPQPCNVPPKVHNEMQKEKICKTLLSTYPLHIPGEDDMGFIKFPFKWYQYDGISNACSHRGSWKQINGKVD